MDGFDNRQTDISMVIVGSFSGPKIKYKCSIKTITLIKLQISKNNKHNIFGLPSYNFSVFMSSSTIRRGVTKRISYIRGKGSIFIFHNYCNEESQDADWERSQNIYCDKTKDKKSEHCSDHECPLL